MSLFVWLYETMTRRPYYSGRQASVDFGPTPGAEFRDALARYSDAELCERGPEIIAGLRRERDRARAGVRR